MCVCVCVCFYLRQVFVTSPIQASLPGIHKYIGRGGHRGIQVWERSAYSSLSFTSVHSILIFFASFSNFFFLFIRLLSLPQLLLPLLLIYYSCFHLTLFIRTSPFPLPTPSSPSIRISSYLKLKHNFFIFVNKTSFNHFVQPFRPLLSQIPLTSATFHKRSTSITDP